MKNLLVFLFQLLPLFMFAQTNITTIEDPRDGRTYEIIEIGTIKWFRDNLRFETASSYCPNFQKRKSACANGNFYTYQELDEVCPQGWRIPNNIEWSNYFAYRLGDQNGEIIDVKIDTLEGEYLTVNYTDTKDRVNLFGASNPLKLTEFGWVEGNRIKNKMTTTIWVKHSEIEDNRFHVHIGNKNYVFHRHKHNIDDAPKKSRKFMVKCVSGGE